MTLKNSWAYRAFVFCRRKRLFIYGSIAYSMLQIYVQKKDLDYEREERFKLEKKIVALEMTNRNLIDNMIIYNLDFDDLYVSFAFSVKRGDKFVNLYCNKSYEENYLKSFGITRNKFIGNTVFEIYPERDASVYHYRDMEIAMKGGTKVYNHVSFDEEGNEYRNIVIKSRKIKDGDTLIIKELFPKKK